MIDPRSWREAPNLSEFRKAISKHIPFVTELIRPATDELLPGLAENYILHLEKVVEEWHHILMMERLIIDEPEFFAEVLNRFDEAILLRKRPNLKGMDCRGNPNLRDFLEFMERLENETLLTLIDNIRARWNTPKTSTASHTFSGFSQWTNSSSNSSSSSRQPSDSGISSLDHLSSPEIEILSTTPRRDRPSTVNRQLFATPQNPPYPAPYKRPYRKRQAVAPSPQPFQYSFMPPSPYQTSIPSPIQTPLSRPPSGDRPYPRLLAALLQAPNPPPKPKSQIPSPVRPQSPSPDITDLFYKPPETPIRDVSQIPSAPDYHSDYLNLVSSPRSPSLGLNSMSYSHTPQPNSIAPESFISDFYNTSSSFNEPSTSGPWTNPEETEVQQNNMFDLTHYSSSSSGPNSSPDAPF